jgi:F-type H+-transporting ATPase subunit b
MNKRDDDIKKDMQKAGTNDNDINELHAKAEKIVMDAKLEAATLREKVIADAKELADSKLEAKRAELANEYLEFEKTLGEAKEVLEKDLDSQMPIFKDSLNAKFSQL